MHRAVAFAAIPTTLILAACGGGAADQTIAVTNEGNVVLNDATANYAYSNDGEMTANDMAAMNATDANMTSVNMMSGDNMAMGNSGM